eukprot:1457599-Rhodomonas_salina.1
MQNGEGMEGRAPEHPVRLGLKWGAGGSHELEEGAGLQRKWSLRKGAAWGGGRSAVLQATDQTPPAPGGTG